MRLHKRLVIVPMLVIASVLSPALASFAGATEPVPFSQKPFTDVPSSSPYFTAVEYLRTNNILKGYLDGTFHPNARLTRADLLQLMTNEFFLPSRQDDCVAKNTSSGATTVFFPDVPTTASFATDICVAKTNSLVAGYPDGKFHPTRYVSFVEAAKMITGVFSIKVRAANMTDQHWYDPYVQSLVDNHAVPTSINVNSDRDLARPLTRGQIAQMIYTMSQVQQTE